jgi:hypothetical protein
MRATSVLPDELRREGARLFDVSMWCLGRDVHCPEGNLLLRRGLVRHARPEGVEGQSAYSMDMQGAGRLVLWGFGVLCECGEAVFVARDGFSPRLLEATPPKSAFRAQELGPWREPATAEQNRDARVVLVSLAGWLAGHEEWVARELGTGWRRTCLEARGKASPVAADALAAAWRRLGSRIGALDSGLNACLAPVSGA